MFLAHHIKMCYFVSIECYISKETRQTLPGGGHLHSSTAAFSPRLINLKCYSITHHRPDNFAVPKHTTMVIKKKKNKHLWTLPAVTTSEVIVRKAIKMKVLIIDEPHTT